MVVCDVMLSVETGKTYKSVAQHCVEYISNVIKDKIPWALCNAVYGQGVEI